MEIEEFFIGDVVQVNTHALHDYFPFGHILIVEGVRILSDGNRLLYVTHDGDLMAFGSRYFCKMKVSKSKNYHNNHRYNMFTRDAMGIKETPKLFIKPQPLESPLKELTTPSIRMPDPAEYSHALPIRYRR